MKNSTLSFRGFARMAVLAVACWGCGLSATAAVSAQGTSPEYKAAFQKRMAEIRADVEGNAKKFDEMYAFSTLVVNGELPPALVGDFVMLPPPPLCRNQPDGRPCVPLSWRDFMTSDVEDDPQWVAQRPVGLSDAEAGKSAADQLIVNRVKRLDAMFEGMVMYRNLQKRGVL